MPRHCCAIAVAARPTIVPLDSRPSLTCSWMARMEAARTDGGGSGGGAGDGAKELKAENGRLRRRAEELAVLAVRANANVTGSASNLAGLVGWFGNNGGAFGGGGGGGGVFGVGGRWRDGEDDGVVVDAARGPRRRLLPVPVQRRGDERWMARMKAARTDGGVSGASDGGGNGSALSAVRSLARATTSWRRGGQQCLGGHTRSAEGRGRNIGRRFKVGWAADV